MSMRCFDEFIRDHGLHDLPLSNAIFTWSVIGERNCATRIVRFSLSNLWTFSLSNLWTEAFPEQFFRELFRIISLFYLSQVQPIGVPPIPFRFENMWLSHPRFKELVGNWWAKFMVDGRGGYVTICKLRFLNRSLRIGIERFLGILG